MSKNLLVIIILGVLVVLSAVQAIQLDDIKDQVTDGKVSSVKIGSVKPTTTTGQAVAPSSPAKLPSMVGGC